MLLTLATPPAHAQTRDSLQKCLSGFEGITWVLPYSPHLTAGNCNSDNKSARIEFYFHNIVAADETGLSYDVRYAAEKKAAFAHFENLFLRNGFQLVDTEVNNDSEAPYVQRARFTRRNSGGAAVLVYETVAANTCLITLQRAGSDTAGTTP